MTIKPGLRCVYIGPGEGRGFIHTVCMVEDGEVVAWSEPTRTETQWGGYAWLGPMDEFRKQFRLPQ